jgi:K+-sensing histidine kinase KdpD
MHESAWDAVVSHEAGNPQDPPLSIPHELRTRLAIITFLSGNLDLLYERLDDDKRRRLICDLRKHTRELSGLIENMLELGDEEMSLSA